MVILCVHPLGPYYQCTRAIKLAAVSSPDTSGEGFYYNCPYVRDKCLGTLNATLGIYIAYKIYIYIYHLFLWTHLLIFGTQNQVIKYLSRHFTNFPYVCEPLTLYSPRVAFANMFYY